MHHTFNTGILDRREFLQQGMWGILLAYASVSSLNLFANSGEVFAQEVIVPKALVMNPHWWKRVFGVVMMLCEIPYLEYALSDESDEKKRDGEFFKNVGMLGKSVNWGTRIVPIREAVHQETEILPYQEFEELLMRTEVAHIGECWCRTTFKNCDRPTNTCIILSSPGNRLNLVEMEYMSRVSREEIRAVIDRAEEAGLVHELVRVGDEDTYYVICNCCPCCCVGLRGLIEFGNEMVVKSEFVPEVNANCTGCGRCLKRCYFSARTIKNGMAVVDTERCMGCGLCCTGCQNDASFLVKRQGESGTGGS